MNVLQFMIGAEKDFSAPFSFATILAHPIDKSKCCCYNH